MPAPARRRKQVRWCRTSCADRTPGGVRELGGYARQRIDSGAGTGSALVLPTHVQRSQAVYVHGIGKGAASWLTVDSATATMKSASCTVGTAP